MLSRRSSIVDTDEVGERCQAAAKDIFGLESHAAIRKAIPTRPTVTLERVSTCGPTLKGAELANCTGDTIAQVADQAHHGIQRVCDSDSLVVRFLAPHRLIPDNEPSP